MPAGEHAGGDVGRLRRFEGHRFIGARDTMVAYDCDDDTQFAEIERRMADDDLLNRRLIQTFGPDELPEARNRGFTLRR
jgi:hypothetical protein